MGRKENCQIKKNPQCWIMGIVRRMNARSHIFELAVEPWQVEESLLSIFHPILFHRTTGKFTYQSESSYSVGTVGYEDVDCDSIDHTYIRTSSSSLDSFLRSGVTNFAEELKRTTGPGHKAGQISLEFFQRKRTRWPFPPENIPWEVWTVRLEIISLANETERLGWREKLGEVLCEKTLYICEVMNKEEFAPRCPTSPTWTWFLTLTSTTSSPTCSRCATARPAWTAPA